MKKNQKTAISGSVILLMIVAMVCYYFYLSNKDRELKENNPTVTTVQEVLLRDLKNNYPPTPKEVIRYYSEITKCFYNEEYTDGELEQLAVKARQLYDDELVEQNEWGENIIKLWEDIAYFKDNKVSILSYTLAASTDVEDFSIDGYDFARLHCIYTFREGSVKESVDHVFLLRKDSEGHWKIYGWDKAENVNPGT